MISYKNSINRLKRSKLKIGDQIINSSDCINRVSASNIYCNVYNPETNNAAFDGFAINSKDTKNLNKRKFFEIIGTIAAGDKPFKKKMKKYQTVEIMTGGSIPKGFDTIIPIEEIKFFPNKIKPKNILIEKRIKKFQHVRFKGSDYKKKDLIVKKGTILKVF